MLWCDDVDGPVSECRPPAHGLGVVKAWNDLWGDHAALQREIPLRQRQLRVPIL